MLRSIAVVAALACIAPAGAQQWPSRPISLLVAFPAGGSDDVLARIVAPRLAEVLGQPIHVENASGQGGVKGGLEIAKAAPDGYRLMLGTSATHALSQLARPLPYDSFADFTPLGLIAEQSFVLVARADLPAAKLEDLVPLSKASGLQYTSAGEGSATHLVCELVNARLGIDARHVARNGGVAALKEVAAGKVDYFCPVITIAIPEVRAQTIKAVAILGLARSAALPDVATAQEQGVRGFSAQTWFALFAPAGLPLPIAERLTAALDETLRTPAVRERLEAVDARLVEPARRTPAYLRAFLRDDIEKWRAATQAAPAAPR